MSDVAGVMRHPRARVVVFAREPQLGRVKSRLADVLGERTALAVYEAMLQRVGGLLARMAYVRPRLESRGRRLLKLCQAFLN